jgi:hypothetical protein
MLALETLKLRRDVVKGSVGVEQGTIVVYAIGMILHLRPLAWGEIWRDTEV